MTDHRKEAEDAITASTWQRQHWGEHDYGSDMAEAAMEASTWEIRRAQVHATLALAPVWLRCVEQRHDTEYYLLNPAHILYIARHEDGQWWEALDTVTGRIHQILSDDDAKVEALIGGQP